MAKITRYNGNLLAFAINSTGTNRTVFGDTTQSDTLDDNLNTDYFLGWEIVGVNENPTREDFNALGFTHGQLLAYLHQVGVPEWNTNQEYHIGSFANVSGVLYESQTNTNTGNDPTADDGTNWLPVKDNRIAVATITPAADTNVTLDRDEYSADVLSLQNGAWTTGHDVIVPDESRLYWVDNSAGSYTATVKTAAGSGVAVLPGEYKIVYSDATDVIGPLDDAVAMESSHIAGLLWSNNSVDTVNDFDVSAGECRSDDDTTDLVLTTAQTKRMDAAWSAGNNGGALATGATAFAAGVSYHVFIGIISGNVELIVDSDPDAANAIANNGLGAKRLVFSFLVETGPALPIGEAYLDGINVRFVNDFTAADIDDTGSLAGALATLAVPTGRPVKAEVNWHCDGNGTSVYSRMTETWQSNAVAPGPTNADNRVASGSHFANMDLIRMTDVNGQIRYRQDAALLNHRIFTKAYTVLRGL